MNLKVSSWTITRKKIRPVFSLGALGLLFSISDRRSGPKLSEQDRRDAAYPYRLELALERAQTGTFHLTLQMSSQGGEWARALSGRPWKAESSRGGPRLVTDLTEYERVLWDERAARGEVTLEFEALE